MSDHSFSRFVYCDINILSHLGKSRGLWPTLLDYLVRHDLTLGVGTGQFPELADAAAHPGPRRDSLCLYPLNALLGKRDGPESLRGFLSSSPPVAGGRLSFIPGTVRIESHGTPGRHLHVSDLFGLVLFYKYYLDGREPSRASDFGDVGQLFALPYCAMAIMEKDLANTLRQIKRHDDVPRGTEIHDIGFFKHWPPPAP